MINISYNPSIDIPMTFAACELLQLFSSVIGTLPVFYHGSQEMALGQFILIGIRAIQEVDSHKEFLSGWNGLVRVEELCQSQQRHPCGRILHTRHQ